MTWISSATAGGKGGKSHGESVGFFGNNKKIHTLGMHST